ncbi:MAG: phosphatase PAP2 family protein [Cyclobacteriaceae bacterium]|nr:phosphatase PAP2 family protein [Cyclobacteriaceae bacterium]
MTWKDAFNSTPYKLYLALNLIALVGFVLLLPGFFNDVIQPKPGIQLNDWFMNLFEPRDWSTFIFIIIFAAPALFFLTNFRNPEAVLLSLQCYVIVNYMRVASIYLFTLEAPDGLIALNDPFLAKVAYGGNAVFVKDLFFSGHTSTLAIVYFIEKRKSLKTILLLLTIIIGLLLIWQRVHYTIDIIGAWVITWLVFKAIQHINSRSFLID